MVGLSAKISVIVPVFNVKIELVQKCIESIINQSYGNIEIIVVDDGNSIDYIKELQEIAKIDERIVVLNHDENKGLYQARLTGVDNAQGEYIAFVDADDSVSIDWFRLLVSEASATGADIVMGKTICEDDDHNRYIFNRNLSICTQSEKIGDTIFEYYIKDCGLDFSIHTVWNKLYKRSLWEIAKPDLNRVKKHLIMTEDILFSGILFFYAKKMAFSDHDGYFYYRNAGSSTIGNKELSKCKKNVEDIELVFSTLKAFMEEKGVFEEYKEFYREWKKRYFRLWSYPVQNAINTSDDVKASNELKELFFNVFEEEEFISAKTIDGYFNAIRTPWDDSLERIKESICNSRTKAVSFDMFDTLVLRPLLNPEDVFYLVVNEINLENYSKEEIIHYRKKAEQSARKKIKQINPFFDDVTITEIYDEMAKNFHITVSLCEMIRNKEIEVEVRLSEIRRTGKELFTLALDCGKHVYITSDMYLEKDTVEKILSKFGYVGYEDIILSSDVRALKTTGKSFSLLIQKAGVYPQEIVHIGDNWNADFEIPQKYGIKAFFLPKTKDILLNYLGNKYTGNAFGAALNNSNSIIDFSKYFESFAVRCITAVSANIMFDNPFVSFNENSDYNGNPYQFGVVALGPHMFGICNWLINLANKEKKTRILFSSRDGFYIQKLFDYIVEQGGYGIRSNYLKISRKSLIPIEIRKKEDILKIYGNCSTYSNSPRSIINRYGKLLLDLTHSIEAEYSQEGIDLNSNFKSDEQFLFFLNELAEKQFSQDMADREYQKCKRYFESIAISEDDLIFDLGYSGKLHKSIVECTGINVRGAYVSKDGYSALKRMDDNNLKIDSYYSFTPSMQGIVNEYIFSGREASCIGYKDSSDSVEAFLEDKMVDYIGDYVVEEINRGAMQFVSSFMNAFSKDLNLIELMPLDGGVLYERFLISPKPVDMAIFEDCLIEDEFFGGVREKPLLDIWKWQMENRKIHSPENVFYMGGSNSSAFNEDIRYVEWQVYNKKFINKSILTKAMYWFVVDKAFFIQRIKDRMRKKT